MLLQDMSQRESKGAGSSGGLLALAMRFYRSCITLAINLSCPGFVVPCALRNSKLPSHLEAPRAGAKLLAHHDAATKPEQ